MICSTIDIVYLHIFTDSLMSLYKAGEKLLGRKPAMNIDVSMQMVL